MMELTILGSGSHGNAAVLQSNGRSILIDAGFTYRTLSRRLKTGKISPESIDAVVITHEHFDHTRGLGAFTRIHRTPVFLNEGTFDSLDSEIKEDTRNSVKIFKSGELIEKDGLEIRSFPVRHDAADPVGFTFITGGKKVGYVTDIGSITGTVINHLLGASLLVLEANHDIEMLLAGNYPEQLKRRIKGPYGHLSNSGAFELLLDVMNPDLYTVCLTHLSRENNRHDVAYRTVQGALVESFSRVPKIRIASQDKVSETFSV